MGKFVAGEVVVLPFPQTNLQPGKRRPALVVCELPGDDLILCQITTQSRSDRYSIPITFLDFERGQLAVESFARVNRLFTVEQSVILYSAAKLKHQVKAPEVERGAGATPAAFRVSFASFKPSPARSRSAGDHAPASSIRAAGRSCGR
jgi:mRNA interferase MazF